MKNRHPKVSVIMGIYNCEKTLSSCLDSLLNQTFQDFEIIMCDDGSSDNTYIVANTYFNKYPDRIVLLKNEKNFGLHYSLNKCLDVAKGKYIARMDGDDISLPYRFEKQVDFLDNNKKYAFVSSSMIHFDENGDWGISRPPVEPTKRNFINGNPFAHGPAMVRKSAYDAVNGYTIHERLKRAEDYDLWVKMYSKGFLGYNIKEPLYKMRDDMNAFSRRTFKSRINSTLVRLKAYRRLKISFYYYVFAFVPIIKGLIPKKLYLYLHKKRLNKKL